MRNMELKMSQHIRRTWSWSVTLKVEDFVLVWTLKLNQLTTTSLMQNVTMRI